MNGICVCSRVCVRVLCEWERKKEVKKEKRNPQATHVGLFDPSLGLQLAGLALYIKR